MFRDSRGVVHTVSSADPLTDLPPEAAAALQAALLQPGDLGTLLERCEAVRDLLDDWQTSFFEGLPAHIDLEEEARVAAEAGLSLEQVEAEHTADELLALGGLDDDEDDWTDSQGELDLEMQLSDLADLDDDPRSRLSEELVAILERALLLLPLRIRLEALIAAEGLVDEWEQLMADHEKLLGHLVLAHGDRPEPGTHDELADRHAVLHTASGPGHP